MANKSDNKMSRFVSLRIPRDLLEDVEAARLPGQPLAWLLVTLMRDGLEQRHAAKTPAS
jgi:hypothetical protein